MKTIKDIAKAAGVSPSTVSRVLNNSGGYNQQTKESVLAIAKKFNYQRNEYASSLVSSKKANVIGVIITNAKSSFSTKVIEGIEDAGYQKQARILLAHCGIFDQERLRSSIDLMIGQNVTGIISISVQFDEDNLTYLKQFDLPLISINVTVPGFPSILIDNYKAAYDATQYLINRGHQRIAFVGVAEQDEQTGRQRIAGYSQALFSNGIKLNQNLIVFGDFSFEAGRQGFDKLLDVEEMPTAIFAASDDTAAGIMVSAYEQHYKVPSQIAIMGFDNSNISKMLTPQLTTVGQPFYEMGKLAVNEILENEVPKSTIMPFQIIERSSVN